MPYVQRDESGAIIGRFANPQPGFAEEYLSDDSPELLPSLNDLKADKLIEVNIACRDAIYAGFDCDALGAMHHYPALDRDQSNLAGSILDSLLPDVPAGWTTPFWCADSAGVWALRPHTAAQIQQVGRVAKATIVAAIARCAGLEGQIEAIIDTDPDAEAALAAIVW